MAVVTMTGAQCEWLGWCCNDNGGHRWGDDGHTELPHGGLNSYMCPSTPPLMETPVSRKPCPLPPRTSLVIRLLEHHRPGWSGGRRGAHCCGWGEPVGQGQVPRAQPPCNPSTGSWAHRIQSAPLIGPPHPSTRQVPPDTPPHPRQTTLPTDPEAWPQAGGPTGPLSPASSPGTSGCCSAGCAASPGTDLPPELRQGQAGIGDNPRDTVPRALSLGRGSVRGLKEIKRNSKKHQILNLQES